MVRVLSAFRQGAGGSRLAFLAERTATAKRDKEALLRCFADAPVEAADVVVALGGHSHMLRSMHRVAGSGLPLFGMDSRDAGFLMNDFSVADLDRRIGASESAALVPLSARVRRLNDRTVHLIAYNEVALLRQTSRMAHIRVRVDGIERLNPLIGDGILLATPAGSTAYNLSAHGPVLPLEAKLLALTPINPFRPRRWPGALISERAELVFDVLQPETRAVGLTADHHEVRDIASVHIELAPAQAVKLLFDPGRHLEDRLIREQFRT